jgi:hypothetical protein
MKLHNVGVPQCETILATMFKVYVSVEGDGRPWNRTGEQRGTDSPSPAAPNPKLMQLWPSAANARVREGEGDEGVSLALSEYCIREGDR